MSFFSRKRIRRFHLPFLVLGFSISLSAWAELPPCLDRTRGSSPLSYMNDQVLEWKRSSKNQFRARALVQGTVSRILLKRKTHWQFEVRLGEAQSDGVEVIYNREFGDLPEMQPGMRVEACGDYITARERSGNYPASPSGAVLHWVHFNPGNRDNGRHEHGFVAVDGVLYGQEDPDRAILPLWNPFEIFQPVFGLSAH